MNSPSQYSDIYNQPHHFNQSPHPQDLINDFELLECIGKGGMGKVWLARHINLNQLRAIKLLNSEYAHNPKIIQWALNEGMLLSEISHPNIIKVYDCRKTDQTIALIMDYIDSGSLSQLLHQRKRIHWQQAKDIIEGVLKGLETIHNKGIIHRDIKPENILLSYQEGKHVPVIIDFGIALDNEMREKLTRMGAEAGTCEYMSPEQIKSGKVVPQSDIYSVGIMFYELLTGKVPFEGSDYAVKHQHINDEPNFNELPSDLPPKLYNCLKISLAKEPTQRYRDCSSFIRGLNRESTYAKLKRISGMSSSLINIDSILINKSDSEANKTLNMTVRNNSPILDDPEATLPDNFMINHIDHGANKTVDMNLRKNSPFLDDLKDSHIGNNPVINHIDHEANKILNRTVRANPPFLVQLEDAHPENNAIINHADDPANTKADTLKFLLFIILLIITIYMYPFILIMLLRSIFWGLLLLCLVVVVSSFAS